MVNYLNIQLLKFAKLFMYYYTFNRLRLPYYLSGSTAKCKKWAESFGAFTVTKFWIVMLL